MENYKNSIFEIAEKEYYFLQGEVGRFDQISHGIKNWSITVNFALIAAAFTRKIAGLLIVSAVSAVLFWMTEARWKRYQHIHIKRIKELEGYLVNDISGYKGPMINQCFVRRLGTLASGRPEERKIMMLGNVSLPHLIIAIFAFAPYVLAGFGFIPTN